jgi:hypothetical protein
MLPPFCRTHGDHDDKASRLALKMRETVIEWNASLPPRNRLHVTRVSGSLVLQCMKLSFTTAYRF